MTSVLITGAAGFIGSNLTKRCLDEGLEVHGVDNLCNGHLEFLPVAPKKQFRFIQNDFASEQVLKLVRKRSYDVVLHLAAVPRVGYSVEFPLETNDQNVTKSLKLIEACKGNVKRVVFASSSSVYGGADILPTHENNPRNPKSPYALQKAVIEDYLRLYNDLYGLDSACLRFFNVFGPNQLGDSPYACAIGAWLTAIKSGRPMRSDGDGEQSRDMCYVDNVVDACFRAAKHEGPLYARCYNVACGERTTNNQILAELMKRYPNAKVVQAPERPGDVKHTQADIRRAKEELGYEPLVRFWEGLDRTIDWYEQNWGMISKMRLNT